MAKNVNNTQPRKVAKEKPVKKPRKQTDDKTLDQLVEKHGGEKAPEKMREQHGGK